MDEEKDVGEKQTNRAALKLLTVPASADGCLLLDFLAGCMGASRRAAKRALDSRSIWVNRRRIWMAHHVLRRGDVVEIPSAETGARTPACCHLRVLVEVPGFLFVDKPAGLPVVGEGGVEALLRAQLASNDLRAVHRLDRDTSGVLMMARNEAAFAAAVSVFRTRRVIKIYHAICAGRVARRSSTIDVPLDGERAVTHLTVLTARAETSYVRVRIETGRTHQIRRHLAGVRHPLLGDRQYGLQSARDPRLQQVPRQMLHATDIELPHPLGHGHLRAHSPLPADFRRCLRLFGL